MEITWKESEDGKESNMIWLNGFTHNELWPLYTVITVGGTVAMASRFPSQEQTNLGNIEQAKIWCQEHADTFTKEQADAFAIEHMEGQGI